MDTRILPPAHLHSSGYNVCDSFEKPEFIIERGRVVHGPPVNGEGPYHIGVAFYGHAQKRQIRHGKILAGARTVKEHGFGIERGHCNRPPCRDHLACNPLSGLIPAPALLLLAQTERHINRKLLVVRTHNGDHSALHPGMNLKDLKH